MNFSAVVVFLSSRCALGDLLPLFFCKLHDSPSEHFPFAIPLLGLSSFAFASVLWYPPDGRCIRCPVVLSIEISIHRYLIHAPLDHNLSSVCSLLVHSRLYRSKCGLQLFRISKFLSIHVFQYVILGSFRH